MNSDSRYPGWKAPKDDSTLILWPSPRQIQHDLKQPRRSDIRIQNSPLRELVRAQRTLCSLDPARPVIADGHQIELYHAGVWAKLALLTAAGRATDAQAVHLAVDTDAPKHLQLRWPGASHPITDDPRLSSAPWSGLLDAPTADHLRELRESLAAASCDWPFRPLAADFLTGISPGPLAGSITHSLQNLDQGLGLHHTTQLASTLWTSAPYLLLTHHILARADQFAAQYNRALSEYRTAHRIHTSARPMPDLHQSADEIEVPYWLDDLSTPNRSRACVHRTPHGWQIRHAGDALDLNLQTSGWDTAAALADFLKRHNLRLSPRALTLTLFVRMVLADLFVHGIGGGRYDQVTDRVIETFFQTPAPPFAVTTATLYFPLAANKTRINLTQLNHEAHHLRHSFLGPAKMELVKQIASLPRQSLERQQAFNEIHARLAAAAGHPAVRDFHNRLVEAARAYAQEHAMFDRELFYAIQPEDRLAGLIAQYTEKF